MLLLAQVQKHSHDSQIELRVLARQHPGSRWVALEALEIFACAIAALPHLNGQEQYLREGQLVLLDQSESGKIQTLDDAIPMILNLIRADLSNGFNTELAQQEAARAEEWRQSLTLQTQELSRHRVEVETRRVQIQQIEESLKQERLALEQQRWEIEARINELKAFQLDDTTAPIES